jgi:hypothetical protein
LQVFREATSLVSQLRGDGLRGPRSRGEREGDWQEELRGEREAVRRVWGMYLCLRGAT